MSVTVDKQPAPAQPPPPRPPSVMDRLARYQGVLVPFVALALAFGIGAILIRLQGVNPGFAYRTIFDYAFFTRYGLEQTLLKTTPLVFTGLAVTVALKVGLFNIGAQGQLLWGAMSAAVVGLWLDGAPGIVVMLAALVAGIAGGAAWGAIAGALKAYRGVHEVISTIMLNSIAIITIDYLVSVPFKDPTQSVPRTADIQENAWIGNVGNLPLPVGFVLAVITAGLLAWMLRRTTLGFSFLTVGLNKAAATYAGIRTNLAVVGVMLLSGGLAGLGGAIETLGVMRHYESGSSATLGFDGITLAFLARVNPLATIPAALLVGALRAGSPELQFAAGVQPEIVDVLLAITLLLVSIPLIAKLIFRRRAEDSVPASVAWGE